MTLRLLVIAAHWFVFLGLVYVLLVMAEKFIIPD
jgi:hypothetical protein